MFNSQPQRMDTQSPSPVPLTLSLDEDGGQELAGIDVPNPVLLLTELITNRNITYTGTHKATAGTVTFQVYGWSKNPLVEYYIIEDYTSASQFGGGGGAGGGTKGTLTVDGSDYTIYETTRTNDPSIVGTSTFHQYISVRKDKRQSGTITTQAHFDAWAKAGMKLGAMDYQVLSTEGYNNAGGSTSQKLSVGAPAVSPPAPSST